MLPRSTRWIAVLAMALVAGGLALSTS